MYFSPIDRSCSTRKEEGREKTTSVLRFLLFIRSQTSLMSTAMDPTAKPDNYAVGDDAQKNNRMYSCLFALASICPSRYGQIAHTDYLSSPTEIRSERYSTNSSKYGSRRVTQSSEILLIHIDPIDPNSCRLVF